VEIRRLLWLEANEEKLRAHGIGPDEVETILVVDDWVPTHHEEYPDQVRIIGSSGAQRLLTVALAPTDDPTVWRPVTGWPSTKAEEAYYRGEE
jgi:hypothetical protein